LILSPSSPVGLSIVLGTSRIPSLQMSAISAPSLVPYNEGSYTSTPYRSS